MMTTPKLPHSTSADRSTKVMGLALRIDFSLGHAA